MAFKMRGFSPFDRCWKGFEPVKGKEAYEKGSCAPIKKASRGPISKVCLPKNKVNSMSNEEKNKVINAKRNAKNKGNIRRDSSSNVKHGGGKSLHAWFNKDNWVQVGNPSKKCGEA